MTVFMTWVKDIFLIILSITFFRVLIPDDAIGKYVDFVFSLVIMAVIIEPLTKLITAF